MRNRDWKRYWVGGARKKKNEREREREREKERMEGNK